MLTLIWPIAAIASDMSLGVVKRNKAANEKAQLEAEDPMPLRVAKIHQEATTRKLTKALNKAGQVPSRSCSYMPERAPPQNHGRSLTMPSADCSCDALRLRQLLTRRRRTPSAPSRLPSRCVELSPGLGLSQQRSDVLTHGL
eukprot:scaffold302_cov247-Pinguiococcus_pyrenoidosus.AAC.17